MTSRQQFFLHVGVPKSGTTFLQQAVFASRDALRAQGLALVPARKHAHFYLALEVRGELKDFDDPSHRRVFARFARQAKDNRLPKALFTHELMGPATVPQIERFSQPLADYDLHLVVTARDLARQISSSWQQNMQQRRVISFENFVSRVRDSDSESLFFHASQDLPTLIDRWRSVVPAERVHVVISPPAGAPRDLLLRRYCEVLGVDAASITVPSSGSNPTLGVVQAELLRRVNKQLGTRLNHARKGYREVGKMWLAGEVLQRQKSERPRVPLSAKPWIEEISEGWMEYLRNSGVNVVGDLEELRPSDDAYAGPEGKLPGELTDGELLDSATAALADILELRDRELRDRELAGSGHPAAVPSGRATVRAVARAAVSRVRARTGR